MPFCPACGVETLPRAAFCARCGQRLDTTPDVTGAGPADLADTRLGPATPLSAASTPSSPTTPRTSPTLTRTAARDGGRFAPGALVADRYRIVGLLGRGGMGEVYRADDLRLDQSVALKFLPDSVAHDPARLAQFHNEVRVARQVTHKNVCRMYDIGEVDGRPFLSMEYVDGEDLGTLLRRIGRLPQDKAVEMARQLCAGLAAAHERGVLHRDLKPANVMVDGEGQVRLTDFGIAGTAEEVSGSREGTPGYMAPEQLRDGHVSVQSDLFSLGLVLYEMFTGRRGIEAKTVDELLRLHERGLDLSTTSTQPDLDPAIDRVIRRCLVRDPGDRPTSALAVSAALPGGDPLAAALAAGETPSPEMVAAAGRHDALRAAVAVPLLVGFAAALFAVAWLGERSLLIRNVPFDRSPEVLADRARGIAASLGYTAPPVDSVGGVIYRDDVLRYIRTTRGGGDRWDWLRHARTAAVAFYYRSSPRRLVPMRAAPRPFINDPPLVISGMVSMLLDTEGRLVQLSAVPPQRETAPDDAAPPTDWNPLLAAAGLSAADLVEAVPEWTPPVFADDRVAWTGVFEELDALPVRIEAASYRGQPVYFNVVGPWTRPTRMEDVPQTALRRAAVVLTSVMIALVLAAAFVMARNNVRSGRGDREGGARLAGAVLVITLAGWLVGMHPPDDAQQGLWQVFSGLAQSLLQTAVIWVAYLALEPLVRRHWPTGIIGWTRVMAGGWRDPLVGRDVLVGMVAGVGLVLGIRGATILLSSLSGAPATPGLFNFESLTGVRLLSTALLWAVANVITTSLVTVLLIVVIRIVVRWRPLAFAGVTLLFALLLGAEIVSGEMPLVEITLALSIAAVVTAVAWRFGLLAVAAMLLVNQVTFAAPVVTDLSTWYAPQTLTAIALLVGLAVTAFVVSRGGEPLLGKRVLEP